jgi:hypothetical protein
MSPRHFHINNIMGGRVMTYLEFLSYVSLETRSEGVVLNNLILVPTVAWVVL